MLTAGARAIARYVPTHMGSVAVVNVRMQFWNHSCTLLPHQFARNWARVGMPASTISAVEQDASPIILTAISGDEFYFVSERFILSGVEEFLNALTRRHLEQVAVAAAFL